MIKYLGSKRRLLPELVAAVSELGRGGVVLDLFSGSARVGHALKAAGFYVKANDHTEFARVLAHCYVAVDRDKVIGKAEKLLRELAKLPPRPGYFTENFCIKARFFHPRNGAKIDAIRERIASLELDADLEAVALVSLMEAADRVDSTTGVQMAYLKEWAPRALHDLELRMPKLLPGGGEAHKMDALEAARVLTADVVYLDPPYNQHSYLGNYHIWETLVRWDKPPVYGIARKRMDCRSYTSAFNSKPNALAALRQVIEGCSAPRLVLSFNEEGHVSPHDLEELLAQRGVVRSAPFGTRRYVGAQIGVFNNRGERVGEPSHLYTRERLYVVAPAAEEAERAVAAAVHARRHGQSTL